jgi:hypothetical protein
MTLNSACKQIARVLPTPEGVLSSDYFAKSRYVVHLFIVMASSIALGQSNPVPLINQPLVPDSAVPGGSGFSLTVNGTGFVSASVVNWNGSARTTTFVNSSQLTAIVSGSDIAAASTASVTVVNPSSGGGTSNVVYFPITAASSSITLMTSSEFVTGTQPSTVNAADLNGDGILDLVVPIWNNQVGILLGNGDGTFQPVVKYRAGSLPFAVAVGDFNADGKLDLAVANLNSNNVSILLGNGDGTFQAAIDYAVGTSPGSVATADFNGDGALDLITANGSDVSVLLGNGDGTFQPAVEYTTGNAPLGPTAVGDFNGDGRLDFAVANQYAGGPLSVFLGKGDGTFLPAVNYNVGSSPHMVAAADFNGDGKLDLATANNISGDVSILLGNGDGTFQPALNYTAGSGANSVTAGDFNGDGKLDLVIADAFTNTLNVLFGNGDGTFQSATSYIVGAQANFAVVGDFNGDGRLDFACADLNRGAVAVALQGTTVTLAPSFLHFGNELVGAASLEKKVTLTNTGAIPLAISTIATNRDFFQKNNCGTGLLPGSSCTIDVTFKPTAKGIRTGTLSITDNAGNNPQTVALTGTGTVVQLTPAFVDFGNQNVGTTSSPETITLTNTGPTPLLIRSIALGGSDFGDFVETTSCDSSLASKASCVIRVRFRPTAVGPRKASLDIFDDGGGAPQQVTLTGTGTRGE